MSLPKLEIKILGLQDYQETWRAMQTYTLARSVDSPDQLWVVEHHPVYTLGLNSKPEHLLNIQDIPVIQSDRGGQVTYHGPGQLIIYTLFDIERLNFNVRQLVTGLETAIINTLAQYGLRSIARPEAPGVYLGEKKIASIGLRIKQGRCYHGLSLNNAMDLEPFQHINPCGYRGLEMTQLADWGITVQLTELSIPLVHAITETLS